MPRDLIGRVNWDLVDPTFAHKVFDVLAACRKRGADYFVISGTRTFEEQQKLWEQGRGMPGPIVTKAKPGQSAHNYGLAVDVCRDANVERTGLQPDYNTESYRTFAEECLKGGLDAGFFWKKFRDSPHAQAPGLNLASLRKIYDLSKGALSPVWAYVNSVKQT